MAADDWVPKPASGSPARGYAWPQLQPGHTLTLRHGAYSPRKVEPVAAELVDLTLAQAAVEGSPVSYLLDATYRPALFAWARAEVAEQLITEWLAEQGGPIADDGSVRPAAHQLERVARRAERMRARLGLDPMSRATLAKDLAIAKSSHDLERLEELGSRLLEERDAERITSTNPVGEGDVA